MRRLCFLLALLTANAFCYKILVISPVFGYSHCNYLLRLSDALAEAGHHVTLLQPTIDREVAAKLKPQHVKDVRWIPEQEGIPETMVTFREKSMENMWLMSPSPSAMLEIFKSIGDMIIMTADGLTKNATLIEELRNEKFDLAIAEPMFHYPFALMDMIGVRNTALAMSISHMEALSDAIGEPTAFSYVPAAMSTYSDKMSFFERMSNFGQSKIMYFMFFKIFEKEAATIRNNFPAMRDVEDMYASASYVFTNSNPYIDFPRPMIAKTIPIGGITFDKSSIGKIPKDFDEILNARNETVLVSFGSVAHSSQMPQSFKNALLAVFAAFPDVTFIWKYEEETNIADHLPNVVLRKWTPQRELLADSRLTGFVTHAGLGSSLELAHSGKPAVMISLFGDQMRNALMLKRHGGVVLFEKPDLDNAEKLKAAISQLLTDTSLAANARRLAEMLESQPLSPREQFVKHVEFAAKYGPIEKLDPYSRQLSTVQLHLIDVFAFVVFCLFVVVAITFVTLRCIFRRCSSQKTKKE